MASTLPNKYQKQYEYIANTFKDPKEALEKFLDILYEYT